MINIRSRSDLSNQRSQTNNFREWKRRWNVYVAARWNGSTVTDEFRIYMQHTLYTRLQQDGGLHVRDKERKREERKIEYVYVCVRETRVRMYMLAKLFYRSERPARLSSARRGEARRGEVRWSEVRWGETRWGEVRRGEKHGESHVVLACRYR